MSWLVASGGQAQFQGTGTLNGAAGYTFLVTAIDGSIAGGPDRIRIKVWNAYGVVYDNQPGAPNNAAPTMPLGGGNIRIH